MRHLKTFALRESSDDLYNILDIKEALEGLDPGGEDYFTVSANDRDGVDLDYSESYDELKFEAVLSEDPDEYSIQMESDYVFDDIIPSLDPSDQSPLFSQAEISRAIDDAITKNDDGAKFVKSIDCSDCSIEWHVVRGSRSYKEFTVQATLNGEPKVSSCDWSAFVESVIRELGSRAAGRLEYN